MSSISDAHPLGSQVAGTLLGGRQIENWPEAELLQKKCQLAAFFTVGSCFDLSIVDRRDNQLDLFPSHMGQDQFNARRFQPDPRLTLIIKGPAKGANVQIYAP